MKARWPVEIAVTSFGLLAVAACATGTSPFGVGGEGGEGSTASSSSSSSGTAGGSSSSNGAGGSSGSGGSSANGGGGSGGGSSSSSSSGTCEMPCQLAPQCGCAAGEGCTVVDASGTRSCVMAGTVPIGGQCSATMDCVAGGLCLQTPQPSVMTCYEYCSTDAQCTPPGGLCVVAFNGTSSGVLATLCSENCDLVTNVGCPVTGMACRLGIELSGLERVYSLCTRAGPGTLGATCGNNSDCAAGYGCFSNICRKYCKAVGTSCPTGGTCTLFKLGVDMKDPTIGNTTYGVCL